MGVGLAGCWENAGIFRRSLTRRDAVPMTLPSFGSPLGTDWFGERRRDGINMTEPKPVPVESKRQLNCEWSDDVAFALTVARGPIRPVLAQEVPPMILVPEAVGRVSGASSTS